MLSVILLVLKIIGILLLLLIGLILVIILTVLLVPIRYRIYAEHGEDKLFVKTRVNWLLHLLSANVIHDKGKLSIRVRVLWFTLYDNQREALVKDKAHKSKVKKSKRAKTAKRAKTSKKARNSASQNKEIVLESSPNQNEQLDAKKQDAKAKNVEQQESKSLAELSQKESHGAKIKDKLFYLLNKIIQLKDKTLAFFRAIKERIIRWLTTISDWKNKGSLILEFLKDEINKEGFRISFIKVKKLLKHILPTKLKSQIIFGTGDPCSTGQAIGAMSVLYGIYGNKIKIIPDFENKILEGKHDAKGRIRVITILMIVIKLILDKRFKRLKNNFQILKEAL